MRRVHGFELEDQRWWPAVLRDGMTDFLRWGQAIAGVAQQVAPHVRRLLRVVDPPRIVDLCSGAGGPIASLAPLLAREGVRFVLTDLYPNRAAARSAVGAGRGVVETLGESVDARDVPPELVGVRTLFMAFHHFHPEEARRILAAAVTARQPIGVFELAERRWLTVAMVPTLALVQFLTAPWQRPWRWSRLLFTYLVPLLPWLVVFDGIVSCLRAYSVSELREMTEGLGGPDWVWEVGRERLRGTPARLTFVLGYPSTAPSRAPGSRPRDAAAVRDRS